MPVRRRRDRRSTRVEFEVTPAIAQAFRAYVASDPVGGGEWPEHWTLHDLLDEAGALATPLCPPCCFHPSMVGTRWDVIPEAVAIYRHLSNATG
jgi:hypothetical protein